MLECIVFAIDCPYCTCNGKCMLSNPQEECEDYYFYLEDAGAGDMMILTSEKQERAAMPL